MDKHFFILVTSRSGDDQLVNRVLNQIRQMVVDANSLIWPRDTVGNEVIYSDTVFLEGTILSIGDRESTFAELDKVLATAVGTGEKLICFAYEMGLLDGMEEIGHVLKMHAQQKVGKPLQYAEVWFDVSEDLSDTDRKDLNGRPWTRIKYLPVQIYEGICKEVADSVPVKPKSWLLG